MPPFTHGSISGCVLALMFLMRAATAAPGDERWGREFYSPDFNFGNSAGHQRHRLHDQWPACLRRNFCRHGGLKGRRTCTVGWHQLVEPRRRAAGRNSACHARRGIRPLHRRQLHFDPGTEHHEPRTLGRHELARRWGRRDRRIGARAGVARWRVMRGRTLSQMRAETSPAMSRRGTARTGTRWAAVCSPRFPMVTRPCCHVQLQWSALCRRELLQRRWRHREQHRALERSRVGISRDRREQRRERCGHSLGRNHERPALRRWKLCSGRHEHREPYHRLERDDLVVLGRRSQ